VLAALGTRRDPLTGAFRPPTEATVRRLLARVDPDALDQAIGQWLARQQPSLPTGRPPSSATRPQRAGGRDGLCGHQPHRRPGRPRPPGRLGPRPVGIEALPHLRDVTFAEVAFQVHAGTGPRAMASLRNLVIGILRRHGHRSIAAALRYYARDAARLLPLPALSGVQPPGSRVSDLIDALLRVLRLYRPDLLSKSADRYDGRR
jgi:hypothetical protein